MLSEIKLFLFLIKCRIKKPSLIIYFFQHKLNKVLKKDFFAKQSDGSEIDVVIPTISKNFETLNFCVKSLRHNLNHKINNVYIVSPESPEITKFCEIEDCIFVDENSVLGYTTKNIEYKFKEMDRSGWLFQQLLKLNADSFVKSENYLVIDSDTVLINKHTFIDAEGNFVLMQSSEWHDEYMTTYESIFGYKTTSNLSFISHMMIFNKEMLAELKSEIELLHNKKWDQVIISLINNKDISYFSEFETYGNWLLKNHPEKIVLIPFYNKSVKTLVDFQVNEENYKQYYNSVSIHKYQI